MTPFWAAVWRAAFYVAWLGSAFVMGAWWEVRRSNRRHR